MRTKWYKASWVCSNCDSLTEQTSHEHTFADWSPTCNCIESNKFQIMLSVEDATIQPNHLTKEEQMETINPELTVLQERIQQLEASYQIIAQRDYATASTLSSIRDSMQEWALEELDSCGINEEQAEQIAEICGFELTKEFEVEITVTYSATVKARNEEDAESAVHDIDFDTVDYNTDYISYMSSSVDRVDI